jgi:hypothetical protein
VGDSGHFLWKKWGKNLSKPVICQNLAKKMSVLLTLPIYKK